MLPDLHYSEMLRNPKEIIRRENHVADKQRRKRSGAKTRDTWRIAQGVDNLLKKIKEQGK